MDGVSLWIQECGRSFAQGSADAGNFFRGQSNVDRPGRANHGVPIWEIISAWIGWAVTVGICAWKIAEGFWRPHRMLEWPFLACAMWAYFYGYMAYDAKIALSDYLGNGIANLGQLDASALPGRNSHRLAPWHPGQGTASLWKNEPTHISASGWPVFSS